MSESRSVMSDSFGPHGLYSSWNSPGQNTGVGSLSFLQGIFPTQVSNPGLPHCRWIVYKMRHKGSPIAMLVGMKKHLTLDLPVSLYSISHFPSCWKGFILQNFGLFHANVDVAIYCEACHLTPLHFLMLDILGTCHWLIRPISSNCRHRRLQSQACARHVLGQ